MQSQQRCETCGGRRFEKHGAGLLICVDCGTQSQAAREEAAAAAKGAPPPTGADLVGHCGVTKPDPGDCAAGHSGSWDARRIGGGLAGCAAHCLAHCMAPHMPSPPRLRPAAQHNALCAVCSCLLRLQAIEGLPNSEDPKLGEIGGGLSGGWLVLRRQYAAWPG